MERDDEQQSFEQFAKERPESDIPEEVLAEVAPDAVYRRPLTEAENAEMDAISFTPATPEEVAKAEARAAQVFESLEGLSPSEAFELALERGIHISIEEGDVEIDEEFKRSNE